MNNENINTPRRLEFINNPIPQRNESVPKNTHILRFANNILVPPVSGTIDLAFFQAVPPNIRNALNIAEVGIALQMRVQDKMISK